MDSSQETRANKANLTLHGFKAKLIIKLKIKEESQHSLYNLNIVMSSKLYNEFIAIWILCLIGFWWVNISCQDTAWNLVYIMMVMVDCVKKKKQYNAHKKLTIIFIKTIHHRWDVSKI